MLAAGAEALGLALEPLQVEQLAQFAALLRKWNKAFNLVSRQDVPRLLERHILDSIAPAELVRGPEVMDLGSGAGLPGLPLAIVRRDIRMTLCDRSERRMRFCRQVVQELGLDNVTIWSGDFGAADSPRGPFNTVVARGVATSPEVWDMVQHTLDRNACVLVYAATQAGDAARSATETAARQQQDEIKISQHDFDIPKLARTHSVLELERVRP